MKTYQIEIKEILARIIDVEAKSKEEAIIKVEKLYREEEIILDYSDFLECEMSQL